MAFSVRVARILSDPPPLSRQAQSNASHRHMQPRNREPPTLRAVFRICWKQLSVHFRRRDENVVRIAVAAPDASRRLRLRRLRWR